MDEQRKKAVAAAHRQVQPGAKLSNIMRVIAARRVELGVSQYELARQLGTDQSHINRWLRGHVQPSAAVLDRLLDALDLEVTPRD